jgi:hypothetical protein
MAALAAPAIEAVVARALAALGAGVVAGAADEAARKRQKEADQAMSTPIARTDAQTKAKEKCKDCPPDSGSPINRPTVGWSEISISYQARIGGLPTGAGFITEWMFGGVTFDGFDSGQCMLKEAKAKYDQFFDEFGYRRDFWKGDVPILGQAVAQAAVALPQPPIQLRWYFMEPLSYRYFSKIFSKATPSIETVYQP